MIIKTIYNIIQIDNVSYTAMDEKNKEIVNKMISILRREALIDCILTQGDILLNLVTKDIGGYSLIPKTNIAEDLCHKMTLAYTEAVCGFKS